MKLAPRSEAVRGNGRLVVISHGSGGNPWVHSDLARALVADGFVVAMPQHRGDNARTRPGPARTAGRSVRQKSRGPSTRWRRTRSWRRCCTLDKVGMYGMSAGGHTALTLAGGRWSPSLLKTHCEAHIAENFPGCVGLATQLRGNFLDGLKKAIALTVIRYKFDDPSWYSYNDARIKAVVAGVPFAADFDMSSLATPRVPLGLVTARQDKWLVPRFNSDPVLKACSSCQLVAELPTGGHGALLSPPPPAEVLDPIAADLLGDPPGFDRSVLPEVDRKIVAFFHQHLLP